MSCVMFVAAMQQLVLYVYLHVPLIWFGRIVHNGLYRFPLLILYSFSTFLHFCTPAYLHRVLLMSYCFFILLLVMSLSPESSHINCIIYPFCHLSSSLVTRVGASSLFDVCCLKWLGWWEYLLTKSFWYFDESHLISLVSYVMSCHMYSFVDV